MRDQRISFRNRNVAACLAFLLPGAGHFYQGRRFKAVVFSVGILSLFVSAMVLGAGQPVYSQVVSQTGFPSSEIQLLPREDNSKLRTRWSWGYGAQVLTGLPALPALIQQARFSESDGMVNVLQGPFEQPFEGLLQQSQNTQQTTSPAIFVKGVLKIEPQGGRVVGDFKGQDGDGTELSFPISGSVRLGREVFGSPRRLVEVDLLDPVMVGSVGLSKLKGSVPRAFTNWFQAPKDNDEINRLHLSLSHQYDIASLLTWIAGLLNMMVIWDAYDGPAYGYGDEKPDADEDEKDE